MKVLKEERNSCVAKELEGGSERRVQVFGSGYSTQAGIKKRSLNHQVKHAILKFQKSYPYCYKTISCKSKCASQRAHVCKGTSMTTAVICSSRYFSVSVPVPFTGPPFFFSLTFPEIFHILKDTISDRILTI